MQCSSCGADNPTGAYYCGGCGRPMGGMGPGQATLVDEPGLCDVPAPMSSLEAPRPSAPAAELRSSRPGKALCSMCMGAYPETSLTVVDGSAYCPDCSPMTGRRGVPETPGGATPFEESEVPAPPGGTVFFELEEQSGSGSKGLVAALFVLLVGGVVFAAVTLFGGDRIDKLLSGVDSGRDDAPLLIQKYSPGEALYYTTRGRVDCEAEGTVLPGVLGQSSVLEFDAILSGRMAVDVLSVDDRGNSRLRTTLEGFSASLEGSIDGEKLPIPEGIMGEFTGLNGVQIESEVDAFGQPIGQPRVRGAGGAMPGGNAGFSDLLQNLVSDVPRKEIHVGDSWSTSTSLPGGMGAMPFGNLGMRMTYEAVGYKKMLGRDCLVIAVEGEMSGGDGPGGLGVPGADVDLEMDLKGAIFFDHRAGRFVKSAVDMDLEMAMSFAGQEAEIRMRLELDVVLD